MGCSRKILVVEDEESIRNLLRQALSRLGYAVEAVGCAEEAVHVLKSKNYAVIITDLFMPGMNGVELCKQIRKIRPTAIVYALSGHVAEYQRSEFDGCLSKPISLAELGKAVEGAFCSAGTDGWRRK